mmetsp:Transcript_8038/g.17343  ORF Transcript_8038/g.17343 Transcript_8038/m.17343 type:complete len:1609 (-) Transcript_8038:37-4863(-)|eukprot:CAMPEP_0204264902 /NCGR_PEP_ID=MMETSP0468-20130131/9319_1 /ASSEMBLY_ACC=CAM_ASM_000383 /TAXON_ID=2969 /ORGANISM="Oxyrrhis marina" /LENGTH=1608 /DNA_ID=CAMNT_0051239811 /DNA_START=110 /DNA_END=4936 /DNA_ORIENTATION=+
MKAQFLSVLAVVDALAPRPTSGFLSVPPIFESHKHPFMLSNCSEITDLTLSLKQPRPAKESEKRITDVTPLKCYNHCLPRRTLYFALQGETCVCFDAFSPGKDGTCDVSCTGQPLARCGGAGDAQSVYLNSWWVEEPKQKNCGPPPAIPGSLAMCADGGPDTGTRQCDVGCEKGYGLEYNSLLCDFMLGKWFGGAKCSPVKCLPPTNIPHVLRSCAGATAKDNPECKVTCMKGYNLKTNTLKCTAEVNQTGTIGYYSGMATCAAQSCGAPPVVPHAKVAGAAVMYPNRAKYTCDKGYTLNSEATGVTEFASACLPDGKYEEIRVKCQAIECGVPPVIAGTKFISDRTKMVRFGESAMYKCEEGYTIDGSPTSPSQYGLACGITGKFPVSRPRCMRVRCGPALRIANAKLLDIHAKNFTEDAPELRLQDGADYECEPGFSTVQTDVSKVTFTTQCAQTGTYLGAPKCYRLNCGPNPEIPNAQYSRADVKFGVPRRVTCAVGHSVDGLPSSPRFFDITCGTDKFLNVPHRECKPVVCGKAPGDVSHARMVNAAAWGATDVHFGQSVQYKCSDGFSVDGSKDSGAAGFSVTCPAAGAFAEQSGCMPINDCEGHTCGPFGECVDMHMDYECKCASGFELQMVDGEKMCGNINDCGAGACGPGQCKDLINGYTCQCPRGHDLKDVEELGKTEHTCIPKMCGAPPQVAHGSTTATKAVFPEDSVFTCDVGYTTNGRSDGPKSFKVGCKDDGQFGHVGECKAVRCGRGPSGDHATRSPDSAVTFNETVEYTCKEGHSIDGTPREKSKRYSVKCLADGSFSKPKTCRAVSCGDPKPVAYAEYKADKVRFGGKVVYSCRAGYSTDGSTRRVKRSFTRRCQANGEFTMPEEHSCKPLKVGPPPTVANSVISPFESVYKDAVAYPQRLTYTCVEGHSTNGLADGEIAFIVKTTTSAEFENVQECKPIVCGKSPPVVNAEPVTPKGVFGEAVEYKCNDGFAINLHAVMSPANDLLVSKNNPTAFETQCLANGRFTTSDGCLNIDDCAGASCGLHGTCVDEVGGYTCNCEAGFELTEGPNGKPTCGNVDDCKDAQCGEFGVCQDLVEGYKCNCFAGYEETEVPDGSTCRAVSCGETPAVEHGKQVGREQPFEFPNVLRFKCDNGYSIDSTPTPASRVFEVACAASGDGSGQQECKPVTCGKPSVLEGTAPVELKEVTFGDKFEWTCAEGHTVNGRADGETTIEQECKANGQYKNVQGCKPVKCGSPPRVAAASRPNVAVFFPGSVSYQCKNGFTIDGSNNAEKQDVTITCGADGKFSSFPEEMGSEPHCQKLTCGDTPEIENGHANREGPIKFGESVNYRCDDGYSTDGTHGGRKRWDIRCTARGVFTTHYTCRMIRVTASGIIRDATNNAPVPGAVVTLEQGEATLTATADENGLYNLPGCPTGGVKLLVDSPGMIKADKNLTLEDNVEAGGPADFSISPVLPADGWRFVLKWEGTPLDLDSYFICGGCQMSWMKRRVNCEAFHLTMTLDVDDTNGWGPETTTIKHVGQSPSDAKCKFWVNNYSQSPNMKDNSKAVVTVYHADAIAHVFKIDENPKITADGLWWDVFEMDAKHGALVMGE